MKRIIALIISSIAMTAAVLPLYAGGSGPKCNTRYPIILVHGAFFKDQNMLGIKYWWGIPGALEDEGASVYVTQQDTYNGIIERSQQVAREIAELLAIHPAWTKVNLIGHSQGPLDCRYMISNLSIPGKGPARNYVASLTSVSGVHRGSQIADLIWSIYSSGPVSSSGLGNGIAAVVNAFMGLFFFNEQDQNSLKLLYCLTTKYMTTVFNPMTPDAAGVYYQSYAGKIKWIDLSPDKIFFAPLWTIMKQRGAGDNDGLVSVESAKWGNFKGVLTGSWWCGGVSHVNEVGHFLGITPGFNAPGFYVDVVSGLKNMGY